MSVIGTCSRRSLSLCIKAPLSFRSLPGTDWAACTSFRAAWTSHVKGNESRAKAEDAGESAKEDAASQTMIDAIDEVLSGERGGAGLPVCPVEETRELATPTAIESPTLSEGVRP